MDFPVKSISKPIISKLIALQNFFFERPRLDVDMTNNQESLYGRKALSYSCNQDFQEAIPISDVKYNFNFYWNFDLRIRNNSSKTAYNIKIESIYMGENDYVSKIDDIISLKETECIKLDYKIRHLSTMNESSAKKFSKNFPSHINVIEIIISYTNESRKKFYTRFKATKESKTNEHLLRKPKKTLYNNI